MENGSVSPSGLDYIAMRLNGQVGQTAVKQTSNTTVREISCPNLISPEQSIFEQQPPSQNMRLFGSFTDVHSTKNVPTAPGQPNQDAAARSFTNIQSTQNLSTISINSNRNAIAGPTPGSHITQNLLVPPGHPTRQAMHPSTFSQIQAISTPTTQAAYRQRAIFPPTTVEDHLNYYNKPTQLTMRTYNRPEITKLISTYLPDEQHNGIPWSYMRNGTPLQFSLLVKFFRHGGQDHARADIFNSYDNMHDAFRNLTETATFMLSKVPDTQVQSYVVDGLVVVNFYYREFGCRSLQICWQSAGAPYFECVGRNGAEPVESRGINALTRPIIVLSPRSHERMTAGDMGNSDIKSPTGDSGVCDMGNVEKAAADFDISDRTMDWVVTELGDAENVNGINVNGTNNDVMNVDMGKFDEEFFRIEESREYALDPFDDYVPQSWEDFLAELAITGE